MIYALGLDAGGVVRTAQCSNILPEGFVEVDADLFAEASVRIGEARLVGGTLSDLPRVAPNMKKMRSEALEAAIAYGNRITGAEISRWAGVEPLSWTQQRDEALAVKRDEALDRWAILPGLAADKGASLNDYANAVLANVERYQHILRAAVYLRRRAATVLGDEMLDTPEKLATAVDALRREADALAADLIAG